MTDLERLQKLHSMLGPLFAAGPFPYAGIYHGAADVDGNPTCIARGTLPCVETTAEDHLISALVEVVNASPDLLDEITQSRRCLREINTMAAELLVDKNTLVRERDEARKENAALRAQLDAVERAGGALSAALKHHKANTGDAEALRRLESAWEAMREALAPKAPTTTPTEEPHG